MKQDHDHKKCSKKVITKAEKLCNISSLKLTPVRKKVLEIISASHKPIKAYDILEKLRNEGFSHKPPTAYRALNFLIENKMAHKINSINSYVACFNNQKEEISCFLVCEKCQDTEEFQDINLIEAIIKIGKNKKINIQNINLEIGFKCEKC